MELCNCWEQHTKYITGDNYCYTQTVGICNGTKEREECTCNGDVTKCNFYPEKRKKNKIMNTAEMWIKAQEDGHCYEMIMPQSNSDEIFYQKDEGLFDGDNCPITLDNFENFDDFMNEQWRLRTMTKSEAEARFNIKIVGD